MELVLVAVSLSLLLLSAATAVAAATAAAVSAVLNRFGNVYRPVLRAVDVTADLLVVVVATATMGAAIPALAFVWPGLNTAVVLAGAIAVAAVATAAVGGKLKLAAMKMSFWFRLGDHRAERFLGIFVPAAILAVWAVLLTLIGLTIRVAALTAS